MKKISIITIMPMLLPVLVSCDHLGEEIPAFEYQDVSLEEVARMFSQLPLETEHLEEVYSAVKTSTSNGYDEEYTLKDLFEDPGAGVGGGKAVTRAVSHPLRSLINDYLEEKYMTRSEGPDKEAVARYIEALTSSDLQIYWPYSDGWDMETYPVITFDPMSDATANTGYEIINENGVTRLKEVVVTEQMAMERPVWIVNTNDDSKYTSLEMLRRADPDWGTGLDIVVKSASQKQTKTLLLKQLKLNRNFDSWFGGASELFVKCGYIDAFRASTEAEMRLYQPSVTDFMIVVKRSQKGIFIPFNAVLITDWSDQLEKFAFLVTEDDGGTTTSWVCDATVKVQSKSYGVTLNIPYHDKDDIIWRGTLSSAFFEDYKGEICHFGDMDMIFDIK